MYSQSKVPRILVVVYQKRIRIPTKPAIRAISTILNLKHKVCHEHKNGSSKNASNKVINEVDLTVIKNI